MAYLVLRDKVTKHIVMSDSSSVDGTMMGNAKGQSDINIRDVEEVRMTKEEYAVATVVPPDPERERNRKSGRSKLELLGLTEREMKALGL